MTKKARMLIHDANRGLGARVSSGTNWRDVVDMIKQHRRRGHEATPQEQNHDHHC